MNELNMKKKKKKKSNMKLNAHSILRKTDFVSCTLEKEKHNNSVRVCGEFSWNACGLVSRNYRFKTIAFFLCWIFLCYNCVQFQIMKHKQFVVCLGWLPMARCIPRCLMFEWKTITEYHDFSTEKETHSMFCSFLGMIFQYYTNLPYVEIHLSSTEIQLNVNHFLESAVNKFTFCVNIISKIKWFDRQNIKSQKQI